MSPGRGRPPQDWQDWPALAALPVGTALLVDSGAKRARIVGRIVHRTETEIHLVDRRLDLHILSADRVVRARIVAGLFHPDDPCFLRGQALRVAVVRLRDSQVLIEYPDGAQGWLDETLIEHADDREPSSSPIPGQVR